MQWLSFTSFSLHLHRPLRLPTPSRVNPIISIAPPYPPKNKTKKVKIVLSDKL